MKPAPLPALSKWVSSVESENTRDCKSSGLGKEMSRIPAARPWESGCGQKGGLAHSWCWAPADALMSLGKVDSVLRQKESLSYMPDGI